METEKITFTKENPNLEIFSRKRKKVPKSGLQQRIVSKEIGKLMK